MIRMSDPEREPGGYERFARIVKKARTGGGVAAGVVGVAAFGAKYGPVALKAVKGAVRSIIKK